MQKWPMFVVAFLAIGAACDSDPETGQSGSGAGSGTPSSSSTGAPMDCGTVADEVLQANCRDCAKTGCCTELAACDNDDCMLRLECEVNCNDDATCIAACASTYPNGEAATAISSCLASSCDVCAASTSVCGTELSIGSPDCDACIDTNCCTEVDACLLDADCTICVESSDGDFCDMNTVYDDTITCFDDNCLTSCSG